MRYPYPPTTHEDYTMKLSVLSVALTAGLSLGGCASTPGPDGDAENTSTGRLVLERPLVIPEGRARALFQGGHQTPSVGYYDPYCELVTANVSQGSDTLEPDTFRIERVSSRLLKDPIAEIPPFLLGSFSCYDPLYQESRWYLRSERQPGVRYLRCLVPYFHCRLGPPAGAAGVGAILGPSFRVESP